MHRQAGAKMHHGRMEEELGWLTLSRNCTGGACTGSADAAPGRGHKESLAHRRLTVSIGTVHAGAWEFSKKKRSISRLASGPRGSV